MKVFWHKKTLGEKVRDFFRAIAPKPHERPVKNDPVVFTIGYAAGFVTAAVLIYFFMMLIKVLL